MRKTIGVRSREEDTAKSMRVPEKGCEDHFYTVEPQINAKGIHVWPFNPSFPVDIRFLTNGHNPNVRMNRHDYFEVLYLLSGAAELRVQDRSLPLNEGDLSIVGSTLYHRLEARAGSRFTVAAMFFLPDIIQRDGGTDCNGYLAPFLLQDDHFPHITAAKTGIPNEILTVMQQIRAQLPADTPLARLAAKTYLKTVLLRLAQTYSSYEGTVRTFERRQKAFTRLQPLFAYVESHFDEEIRVARAARACGMSISHFINFFKNATGQSFVSYLNYYRIERAQQLLASTDRSLTDIGLEVGFCDQSYFGMVFRRLVGMAPSNYRGQFRNDLLSVPDSQMLKISAPHSTRNAGEEARFRASS